MAGTATSAWLYAPIPSSLISGLVGYWTLNETSGNALDSSGNGISGTNTSVTQGSTGIIGNSYSYNGTSSVTNFGSGSSLQLFSTGSISAWINFGANTNDYVISLCDSTGATANLLGIGVYTASSTLYVTFTTGNSASSSSTPITSVSGSTWYHVVVTWASGAYYSYFNGSNIGANITFPFTPSGTATLLFGKLPVLGAYFTGSLDEVGIWNRQITSSEVTTLYNSGAGNTYPF